MRIHRSSPDSHFTIIPNETLRDQRLSYRARGLLAEILSRPDGWMANADSLAALARHFRGKTGEGRGIVRAAFRELQEAGYMRRVLTRGPRGRFATELHFYDVPVNETGDHTAGTPVPPAEIDISPGRTDDRLTGRRSTGAPVTGAPATGAPVGRTSSRRPDTKTSSTGPPHKPQTPAASAEAAAMLDAAEVIRVHTDADDGEISELLDRYQGKARNLGAYVTGLAKKGHLARDLQELRSRRELASIGRKLNQLRTGPPCEHDDPGGAALHPLYGTPLCPQCRNARTITSNGSPQHPE